VRRLLAEKERVMDIPEPPDRPICAGHGPLKWGFFPATLQGPRWVAFTIGEGGVLVPHVCDDPDRGPRWQPDEVIAERARHHAGEIRALLAERYPKSSTGGTR
jgi:hypothetical protein